jgi:hypothetical protein
MHVSRLSFLALLAAVPVAYALPELIDRNDQLHSERYKVDEYIRSAVALQSLDREAAIKRLHALAQDIESQGSVIILCRMLFTRRPGSGFRPPFIVKPMFLGETTDADWPLWPIALIDGIPFLVVVDNPDAIIGGLPESDEMYLRYCEADCDWSNTRYTPKTEQQKRGAMERLLASGKWKTNRDMDYRRRFFAQQIQ